MVDKIQNIYRNDEFKKELELLINKYSIENESDTPDWIIAEYMMNSLQIFNNTINQREKWYDRSNINKIIVDKGDNL